MNGLSENEKITPDLIETMIARAQELAQEPNTYWTDQFNKTTAPPIT